jgi:O-methyltransferase domain
MTALDQDGPGTVLSDLLRGPRRFAALHALTVLGCARHLAAGPLTTADLARRCEVDADALERLLRCCATLGLLAPPGPDGAYALTAAGRLLDPEAAGSLVPAVLVMGNPPAWQSMLALDEAVRTGQPVFPRIAGSTFWEWHESHPEDLRAFQAHMVRRSAEVAAAMATLDLSDARVIADIGGGYGVVLAAVLAAHPRPRGVLVDRAEVVSGADKYLTEAGLAGRYTLVGGDFFAPETIPAADAYLLCNILHDFSDQQIRTLLGNITAAASAPPRVLLADMVLPDDLSPHIGFEQDMRRMALDPGRERTRGEYESLLRAAGLEIVGTVPVGPMTIVDARAIDRDLGWAAQ